MGDVWQQLHAALVQTQGPACWVEVLGTQGSAPRQAGAWMVVWPTQPAVSSGAPVAPRCMGTIGGGHLEWMAQQQALAWLARGDHAPQEQRVALGPSLGQCCGGAVQLRMQLVCAADVPALRARLQSTCTDVVLFGAGHVAQALARVLVPLPFALHSVDSRADWLAQAQHAQTWPAAWQWEHSQPVHGAVATMPAQACVLVMSYSHQEDLDVVQACLQRQRTRGDVPFIGLIGSATKWAVFQRRLLVRGFSDAEIAHITCPIGVPGITGKEPEVIAVGVAAQLLQWQSQMHASARHLTRVCAGVAQPQQALA